MRYLLTGVLLVAFFLAPLGAEEKPGSKPGSKPDATPDVRPGPKADAKPAAPNETEPPKEPEGAVPKSWLAAMPWRSIGPGNMGGRITALAVYEQDPTMWWAATASGGLLKTVDNGITFEHQFDHERVVSIGDVAVAQSDPKIVWVGTGECNPRNSVSWGNGVYKSLDGGKTWKHMGLEKTFQIGAVRIHPTNPDIVYVGALGRLWGHNSERGLYKTTDGGKSWKRIHHVDEKTGVIDVQMHPGDPDTLLIGAWERQRAGYDVNAPSKKWGPGSGVYRTTDGGKTFSHITAGLPTVQIGRIGIDFYRKDPNVVFMVLETERIGAEPPNAPYMGITGKDADAGARLTSIIKKGPAEAAGFQKDDIVLAIDGKTIHSYTEMLRAVRQHVAGDTIKVEVSRERKGVEIALKLGNRPKPKTKSKKKNGPVTDPAVMRSPRSPFGAFLGGQRANMHDQQGKEGHEYGGVYKSLDAGVTWQRINSVNPRPMYFSEIRVDPSDEMMVWLLGIRLWKSVDGGAKFTPDGHPRGVHVDHHALWIDPANGRHMVLGNDGGVYVTYDSGKHYDHLNHVAIGQFYDVAVGPRRDYRAYGGLQDNGSWGGPSRVRHAGGPSNADWIRIGGGDGFRVRVDEHDPEQIYFESQYGGIGRRHLRTGERRMMKPRAPKGSSYRFNWSTPYLLSKHNSRIYYAAGNRVFRSLAKGNGLKAISPELATTPHGSASALAESPRDEGLLYVGTDDGAVWITEDGGHAWRDLYAAPKPGSKPKSKPAGKRPEAVEPASASNERPRPEGTKPPSANGNGNGDEPKADEATPGGRRGRLVARLMQRDENKDGLLQRSELPERLAGLFERADTNKDGGLDPKELAAGLPRGPGRRGSGGAGRRTPAKPQPEPEGRSLREAMPDRRWVASIEPSRHLTDRVYLVFDGHRSDDDRAHVFVSENRGETWRSIRSNLPNWAGTTRVLREDLENPDLLYLGTELGAWVSVDRGASWTSLNTNLPTVAVHAFAQHPTAGEIVTATHGRSLWVMDVTALRQMTAETLRADAHLYKPAVAVHWRPQPSRGRARGFMGQNPRRGAAIHYSLGKKADKVELTITAQDGTTLRTLETKTEKGLHVSRWDLRRDRPKGARRRFRSRVKPGSYRAVLVVGEKRYTQDFTVEMDPDHPDPLWMEHEDLADEAESARRAQKAQRYLPQDAGRDE